MIRALPLFFGALLVASSSQAAQIVRGPFLQSAAGDRMTICWRTDVATTSEVAHSKDLSGTFTPVSVAGSRTDHAVTISGLDSGSTYFYQVRGTPESGSSISFGGPNLWFRTAAATTSMVPTRLWVVGDSGYGYPAPVNAFNAYMNLTASEGRHTDAFLMLGDNAYDIGTDSQITSFVFWRYGQLLRNTPLWSAFGNHDGYSVPSPYTAITPYETSFRFPTGGECGGIPSGTERYYSFNHGSIHFICLDTNTSGNFDDAPGGTYGMVDWLLDDLKACTADWIIAFMHQGPYSKGSHNSDTELGMMQPRVHIVPLLESYGVDLVLHGHSHCYERSGLMDGHYGHSSTFNAATMRKWPGNGSDLGGVDSAGTFVAGSSTAGGAYQKPAATGRAGTVYTVIGASSAHQQWASGSWALVNPAPHPAHLVSLLAIGSMVIDIDGHRLNARYLGETGAVRDDFTILKGATYTLHGAMPTVEGTSSGVSFPVTRSGSTAFAESVPVAVDLIAGGGVTPLLGTAEFAPGESSSQVRFFPVGSDPGTRFEARLVPSTRAVQPGGSQRSAYRIAGGPRSAQFAATPAGTWYASRFANEPPNPDVWQTDDDGDGLSLLLEYALGGEPGRNDAALIPRGTLEGGSFIFRYNRPPGRTDLVYRALGSQTLQTWSGAGLTDVSDGSATALGEPRKVGVPSGSAVKFVRLEILLQP